MRPHTFAIATIVSVSLWVLIVVAAIWMIG
jgi:membrane protein DedA with SNARE-associated domain